MNKYLKLVKSIKPGDKVTALFPNGFGNPPKARTGKANALLIFPDYVILDMGGRHGKPGFVSERNIVSVEHRKAA